MRTNLDNIDGVCEISNQILHQTSLGVLPDNSWQVKHHCLDEEDEDDPLIVLVIDNLLTRDQRSNARVRVVSSYLTRASYPIFLPYFTPPIQ